MNPLSPFIIALSNHDTEEAKVLVATISIVRVTEDSFATRAHFGKLIAWQYMYRVQSV